jgi:hypothetical protein
MKSINCINASSEGHYYVAAVSGHVQRVVGSRLVSDDEGRVLVDKTLAGTLHLKFNAQAVAGAGRHLVHLFKTHPVVGGVTKPSLVAGPRQIPVEYHIISLLNDDPTWNNVIGYLARFDIS